MKLRVSDADYQTALWKFAPLKWEPIKAEARRLAAERTAEEVFAEIEKLLPRLSELEGDEFKALSDAIDVLFARHALLSRAAWPGVVGK